MRTALARLVRAWGGLGSEQRMASVAAMLMFVTMFLPWYQRNAVVTTPHTAPLVSSNLTAFNVFSFVEAAVLLVALAVLFLLFARGERRTFHLPGGDGTVVLAAGLWVALLLVWRLFDKPGVITHGIAANVGIQWGIFFALACAGLLAYSGSRMRAVARPEPPLRHRRPRAARPPMPPMPSSSRARPVPARASRTAKPEPTEQLSFEDSPPPEPEDEPPSEAPTDVL